MLRSLAAALVLAATIACVPETQSTTWLSPVLPDERPALLLPGQLPRTCHVDTKFTQNILWSDKARRLAEGLLEKGYPNEAGGCLYGGFERTPGGYILHITTAIEAEIIVASPDSVQFVCPRDPSWLGTVHTHTDSTKVCKPSPKNFGLLMWEDQAVVEYIFCANGVVYWQLKDPRWGWQLWREP